jgi:predicted RNA binding protein YcfA (HicA-like mRNA interferase family)
MERVLKRLGFKAIRSKGGHVFYRHPDGRTTTLPHHVGRDIAKPLLREIDLTPEDLERHLKS